MIIHGEAAAAKWSKFTLLEQLANIGADVSRAINWKRRDCPEDSNYAFERALELWDFTIADPKNRRHLREIVRARELFIDFFLFNNEYHFTDEWWHNYFLDFGYRAAIARGK